MCSKPPPGPPPQHLGCPVLGEDWPGTSLCSQCPQPAVCPAGKAESEPKNSLAPRALKSPGQSAGRDRPSSRVLVTGSGPRLAASSWLSPLPRPRPAHSPQPRGPEAGRVLCSHWAPHPWRHVPLTGGKLRLVGTACQALQVRGSWGSPEREALCGSGNGCQPLAPSVPPDSGEGLPAASPGAGTQVLQVPCRSPHPALGLPPVGPAASLAQMVVDPPSGSPQ